MGGLNAAESERAVPYPEGASCVSTARASGKKAAAAKWSTELQAVFTLPYSDGASCVSTARASGRKAAAAKLSTDLQAVFTFSHVSDAAILTTIFTELFSKPHLRMF